jgi:hypothetical protein
VPLQKQPAGALESVLHADLALTLDQRKMAVVTAMSGAWR